MAGTNRWTTDRVKFLSLLRERAFTFDFHQVMRRLETFYRDRPRWGEAVRPTDEPVRLGQEPELSFPPTMLSSFIEPAEDKPGRLIVRFFGLFGPGGPLPLHLTEYARERLRHASDPTFTAFANLFHHRLLVLFHRAWSVARPTAEQDRPQANRFDRYIGALCGTGMSSLLRRDSIPDAAKLQYAGWLSHPTRTAEGLRALLADYFGYPVTIEEFVGEWVELPEDGRWRLGVSREVSSLGFTTVIGRRMWRCDHKFRVVLGPLKREELRGLLPGTPTLDRLSALVRAYVGDEFEWDVRLILAEDASNQVKLGRGDRLGWYARLGKRTRHTRREDVIVHPASHRTQRSAAQQ